MSKPAPDFNRAREIYKFLVNDAKVVQPGGTAVTYTEVAEAIGGIARGLGPALDALEHACIHRSMPMLSVFVVRKEDGLPSHGCRVTGAGPVKKAMEMCQSVSWPSEPWW